MKVVSGVRLRAAMAAVTCGALLSGCPSLRSPPPFPQNSASGEPGTAQPPAAVPPGAARPAREFHLGAAASSLVGQAHKQSASGDYGLAAATIERAMRIEPDNPLLWIELGRVRLTAGDNRQAESMGRKALAMATGDPRAQSASWRLIADALRALGRNDEAVQADRHANGLTPH
jgi:Tfp pilus assembly protein PilF